MRISDLSSDVCSSDLLVSSGPCGPSTVITSPPTRMSYGLWARSEVHSYILVVNRSICRWVVSAVSPDTHPSVSIQTNGFTSPSKYTWPAVHGVPGTQLKDRKSTRLNSSH